MVSLGEQLIRNLSAGASEGAEVNLGWVIWLVFAIAGFVVFFIIGSYFKKKFDFDGSGETHGYFEITRNGTYPLRGNLATYKMIDDDELKLISKHIPEFKNFYDIVQQLKREGNLYLYTIKITDDSDIQDKLGTRARIMCAYPLESSDIHWLAQKGKLTFTSILRKEKTRYLYAVKSFKKQIMNEDRNKDDWYVLVPFPRTIKKETTVGFGNLEELKTTVYLKEITLANALMERFNIQGYVADAVIKNEFLISEKESIEDILKERTDQLKTSNIRINKLNYLLSQKAYVQGGKSEVKKQEAYNDDHISY